MSSPIRVVMTQKTSEITPRQKFEGHIDFVYGIIHLPGGQRIMTCSRDGSLRVRNMESGKQIGDDWQDRDGGNGLVWTIALSPDGKKVVSGSMDGGVRLWDIDTGKIKIIAKWLGHTDGVKTVCWSGDGRRVLSVSRDGTVREWDVEKGATILGPIKTGHEWVNAAVYSPDMTMFATGGREQPWNSKDNYKCPIRIWDTRTGKLVVQISKCDFGQKWF